RSRPAPESARPKVSAASPRRALSSKPSPPHTPPTRSSFHRSTSPPTASDRDAPDSSQTPSATDRPTSPPLASSPRCKRLTLDLSQTPPTAHRRLSPLHKSAQNFPAHPATSSRRSRSPTPSPPDQSTA